MEQKVKLKYINQKLQIGVVSWRQVYLLQPSVIPLLVEVDKGRLVYKAKGSGKRFSYHQVKKDLIKTSEVIIEEIPDWLF